MLRGYITTEFIVLYILPNSPAYVNLVSHQTAVPGDGYGELVVTARGLVGHEVQLKKVTKTKRTY